MDTGADHDDDGEFGLYEAQCVACDSFTRVDDIGLCSTCAGKFERDMIRERQWDYSALAFGTPSDKLENLRQLVTDQHGEALELIAPTAETTQSTMNHANSTSLEEQRKRRKR